MTLIIPSEQQRACRSSFKAAVTAAKKIFDDPAQKALWERKLQCRRRLFNRIVQFLLAVNKSKQSVAKIQTSRLIINCFKAQPGICSLTQVEQETEFHLTNSVSCCVLSDINLLQPYSAY